MKKNVAILIREVAKHTPEVSVDGLRLQEQFCNKKMYKENIIDYMPKMQFIVKVHCCFLFFSTKL